MTVIFSPIFSYTIAIATGSIKKKKKRARVRENVCIFRKGQKTVNVSENHRKTNCVIITDTYPSLCFSRRSRLLNLGDPTPGTIT